MRKVNFMASDNEIVIRAVNRGIERYIQSRKNMVPGFVRENYSLKGSLRLHRKAIGSDLIMVPINILWSVVKIAFVISSILIRKIGLEKLANKIDSVPQGFETNVEKQINWLIYSELLEIPYEQENRRSTKDAFLDEIMKDKELSGIIEGYLLKIKMHHNNPEFRDNIEKKLREYGTTRISASELASNILLIASSYATLNRASFGALGAGKLLSAAFAKSIAISNFLLGPTIGGWYYSVVPVTVSLRLLVSATGFVILFLAIISTFIGIILDPLQAWLGIHQRRLNGLIDMIQADLTSSGNNKYNLKEKYVSRVFDILDMLSLAART